MHTFLLGGINRTLELLNDKVRDALTAFIIYSLPFISSAVSAADSSVGNLLQSEADASHGERRRAHLVGPTGRTDDTCGRYTKVPF